MTDPMVCPAVDGRLALATGAMSLEATVAAAREAEALGCEAVLVGENVLESDALVGAAAVLQATTRVRCGPGIANVYDRHPVALARGAATLDRLAPGRALLGLGRSAPDYVEHDLGLAWQPSHEALADAVRITRTLLAGRAADHRGRRWSAHLGPAPARSRAEHGVPVLLAAVGPRTLRLAGELADGVLLNYGAPPEYVAWAVDQVRGGAQDAGRDPDSVDVLGYLFAVRTDAPDAGRHLASLAAELRELHSYPDQGPWLSAQVGAPEEWDDVDTLRRFALVGTREQCLARLAEYRAAGLRCPVLLPSGLRALQAVPSHTGGSSQDPLL